MSFLRRHPLLVALVAAILLFIPSSQLPFVTDDFTHLTMIEDKLGIRDVIPGLSARHDPLGMFNLFGFFDGNSEVTSAYISQGFMPWWTYPEVRLNFWRPLTSYLEMLDYQLWGRHPLGFYLHSLLWYLALIALVSTLYHRSLGAVAGFSLLLFAIDDAHWMPVGWIANRNAVIAATCAVAGLVAHIRWREERWRPGLPLSLVGYALGLAGGETALGVVIYLICYEFFAAHGSRGERVRALVPAGILCLTWAIFYKFHHFGASGSGMYLDPVGELPGYLLAAPARFLLLVASLFGGPPSQAMVVAKSLIPLGLVWGVSSLALCVYFGKRILPTLDPETLRALRWWVPGALLSMIPVLATFPMDRLLLVPSIGAMPVIALVGRWCWEGARAGNRMQAAFVALMVLFHGIVPAITWTAMPMFFGSQEATLNTLYTTTFTPERAAETDTLVLNASDMLVNMYFPMKTYYDDKPMPSIWQVLSPAPHPHRVTRVDEKTFELEVLEGGTDDNMVWQLYRAASKPFLKGERVRVGSYEIEVLTVGARGVSQLRVTSPEPLENIRIVSWLEGTLKPITLPAPGQSLDLPWTPGPMGM